MFDTEKLQQSFICIQTAIPYLNKSRGVIVNICPPESFVELQSIPRTQPGILALSEYIGRAYPEIKCNAIRPVVTPYVSDGRQDIGTAIGRMVGFLVGRVPGNVWEFLCAGLRQRMHHRLRNEEI